MKKVFAIWGMVAAAAMLAFFVFRKQPTPTVSTPSATPNTSAATVNEVKTPATTETAPQNENTAVAEQGANPTEAGQASQLKPKYSDDPFDYGRTPRVKADVNEQVRAAVEGAKGYKNPERLSVFAQPKPFDPESYKANREQYLRTPEPGRALMPAQPSETTTRIQAVSPERVRIKQGESTVLRVKSVPGFPVTWTSWSLGKFSNELTTITVEADENGLAQTTFSAPPGTIEDVHIVCAGSMSSGQIRYTINVSKP